MYLKSIFIMYMIVLYYVDCRVRSTKYLDRSDPWHNDTTLGPETKDNTKLIAYLKTTDLYNTI